MAIKSSGSLSLTEIEAEFGGSSPTSLNEYYSGGSYVPAGTVGYPNGAGTTAVTIPSSGQISFSNFYGSTKIPNNLAVRILMVGGGGAGGMRGSGDNTNGNGGGGAGAVYDVSTTLAKNTYTVTIGKGGSAGLGWGWVGQDGGKTIGFGYTINGGGYGGNSDNGPGHTGGSGGGGAANYGAGGVAIAGQTGVGYAGGQAGAGAGGGGGGAGGAGSISTGGAGYLWIDGKYYAGGGGASNSNTSAKGGGGQGGVGLGWGKFIASFYCTYQLNTDGETYSYWSANFSWNPVDLPYGGVYRVWYNGNYTETGANSIGFILPEPTIATGLPAIDIIVQVMDINRNVISAYSAHCVPSLPWTPSSYSISGNVSVTFSSIYAYNTTGVADINNTNKIYGNNAWFHGGGGGGGTQQGSGGVPYGGAGYKGIVVVSYEWPYQLATGGTVTSSGGRYYHYLTDTGQQFSW